MMPIEFWWGFIVGMLIMFGIVTLAAIIQFIVDWTGPTAWPEGSELIDGQVDEA